MENLSITQIFIGTVIGAVVACIFSMLSQRRAKFVYSVTHSKIGTSTDNPIFGSIKVLYNDLPAKNLWLSTLEITNTSLTDFKEVPIQIVATAPAIMLNQTLRINETYPNDLHFDDDFKKYLVPDDDNKFTDTQIQLYNTQRCFKIPVVNRGDRLTFTYLTHIPNGMPELHASIRATGIRCKYKPLTNLPLDLPYTIVRAICFGLVMVVPTLLVVINTVTDAQVSAIIGFFLGFLTSTIGFYIGRVWDKLRNLLFN